MTCPGSWGHTWAWGQGTFLWRGFSAPNTGFFFPYKLVTMCSLFFQAFLEMGWRALGAFGGSNPTPHSMPTSSLSFLVLCCGLLSWTNVLRVPGSLLQPNPVLPHSVLIPMVPSYYQQFFCAIASSSWLAPQLLGIRVWDMHMGPLFSGNSELKRISLWTAVYRTSREWALIIVFFHPGHNLSW